ncbi:MAG: hypothetical protein ACK4MV_01625 [Beijerinckiaceae bacterium]
MRDSVDNIDLCALMDAECPASERKRIEEELARSPHCAQRLAAWRRNDAALRFALCAGLRDDFGRIGAPAAPVPGLDASEPPLRTAAGPLLGRPAPRVRAAAIAAFAGGTGAAAVALAILVLSGR